MDFKSLSSLLPIEDSAPSSGRIDVNALNEIPQYAHPVVIPTKKHQKYIVADILNEFTGKEETHAATRKGIDERYLDNILRTRLMGNSIPEKGFMVDWNLGTKHLVKTLKGTKKVIGTEKRIHFYDLDLKLPNDRSKPSSLREVVGVNDITIIYSIPLRFLTSKINKKAPPRGRYWVYRIRFILKDNEQNIFEDSIIEQFYNGYIGVSSRHALARLHEHVGNYKEAKRKLLYLNWADLEKNKLDHIVIFEILDRVETEEQMYLLEEKLIEQENTLAPNGFNMIPGGKSGEQVLKENSIECTDRENKDDLASRLLDASRKRHYVRQHIMKLPPNRKKKWTMRRGHWRGLGTE